jgi:AcrR family transcriptional regulator
MTRAEQQARTRQALIDAAAEVVVERGLAGASIERIVARAGFTRGAFHSNFSSREELFVELLQQRVYAQSAKFAQEVIAGDRRLTPRKSGEAIAQIHERAQEEAPWMFQLWFELVAASGRDETLRERVADFWRTNMGLYVEAIKSAARDQGRTLHFDPETLATAVIAIDIGLATQRFVDPERVSLDIWPDAFEVLFNGGVKPE